jgi:uncharacterized repeat protein (TIGR03803 family)
MAIMFHSLLSASGISGLASKSTPHALSYLFVFVFAAGSAQGQTYTILHTFNGADGGQSDATPVLDAAGNLYGTAPNGGQHGYGVVYKLDTSGNITILHHFTGGADGARTYAPVIFDPAGNLYGTTQAGGKFGYGTVFKLDAAGNVTTLHDFEQPAFGVGAPTGGLYRGAAGYLFGVATMGGRFGFGSIFRVDVQGHYFVLHEFAGPPDDGANPQGRLLRDAALNFYGTASHGGTNDYGLVFKLDAAGNYSVLHYFSTATGGIFPVGSLMADPAGHLFGTTWEGGTAVQTCPSPGPNEVPGCGVVYKLNTDGTIAARSLDSSTGRNPYAGLVRDAAGNMYGTTYLGESRGAGAVFKLDTHGKFTILHVFGSMNGDGANPSSGVVMDAFGNLYGTTRWGGTGDGVIYSITP